MAETFHLGLDTSMLDGATLAIVPGDPKRVEKIAQLLDEPTFLAEHREFTSVSYTHLTLPTICSV